MIFKTQNLYNPISLKITAYKSTELSIRETASPYLLMHLNLNILIKVEKIELLTPLHYSKKISSRCKKVSLPLVYKSNGWLNNPQNNFTERKYLFRAVELKRNSF